jgi:AraC-like DNA-binding protein
MRELIRALGLAMKQLEPPASACSPNSVNGRNGHSSAADKIGRSVAYMTQHLNQPLQVAVLAALANVSPSHYFALFKRQTGCAPMGYFIRLRMERARALLDTTSSSVKEIAALLGYQDPFYFSRLFKSVNQVAPSQYRDFRKKISNNGELAGKNGKTDKPDKASIASNPDALQAGGTYLTGSKIKNTNILFGDGHDETRKADLTQVRYQRNYYNSY